MTDYAWVRVCFKLIAKRFVTEIVNIHGFYCFVRQSKQKAKVWNEKEKNKNKTKIFTQFDAHKFQLEIVCRRQNDLFVGQLELDLIHVLIHYGIPFHREIYAHSRACPLPVSRSSCNHQHVFLSFFGCAMYFLLSLIPKHTYSCIYAGREGDTSQRLMEMHGSRFPSIQTSNNNNNKTTWHPPFNDDLSIC